MSTATLHTAPKAQDAGSRAARSASRRPATAAAPSTAPVAPRRPATSPARQRLIERYGIPTDAQPYLDVFFTQTEITFAAEAPTSPFTIEEAQRILDRLAAHGNAPEPADAATFLDAAYRRAVVDLVPDDPEATAAESARAANPASEPRYRLGTFYSRLDVFAISEQDAWRTIPDATRTALDAWYFDAYIDSLDPGPATPPTQDAVLSLDGTLAFIDKQDRPIYLNTCDCRSLANGCAAPRRVCLTYKSGPNTFSGRGLSDALTKEQAKDVVRQADKAGLMHTANPNGICNCCGDCCYLFRGQRRRDSLGTWPIAPHVVAYDAEKCISCGRCVKRCHFDVFALKREGKKRTLLVDTAPCVGCGLCVSVCPTHALSLVERN